MAQWKDVVHLIRPAPVKTNGVYSADLATSPSRKLMANQSSVSQREYYDAAAVSLRPEVKFTIRTRDYQDEKFLMWKGNYYKLDRTQQSPSGETITFTVIRLATSKVNT